jgi:hypothetical protein
MVKPERVAAIVILYLLVAAETLNGGEALRIDGANGAPVNVFHLRNLPSGLYQVTGVLVGVHGRRGLVSRLAKVEPPFGR